MILYERTGFQRQISMSFAFSKDSTVLTILVFPAV